MARALDRRWSATALVMLVAFVVVACGDDDAPGTVEAAEFVYSEEPRAPLDQDARHTTKVATREFASDLYHRLVAEEDGNFVFSPYSVVTALAMTRAGAAGETAGEIDAVLHATLAGDLDAGLNATDQGLGERPGEYHIGPSEDDTAELVLSTANQLWGQDGVEFKREFLDHLARYYGAGMRLVDFEGETEAARQRINDWVGEQTRDRIPELLPPGVLDEATRLVLTNAMYLNAPWLHAFDAADTEPGTFTRLDGSETEADMMSLESVRLQYVEGDDFEAVRLPYAGSELAMIVVLPAPDAYSAVEAGLDGTRITEITEGLGDAMVDLRMPRFEFRTQAGLKQPLIDLGMARAFEPGAADFSRMSAQQQTEFYLQDALHETFISVDEEGTEAAAATAVVAGEVSAPTQEAEVTLDRPFLFFVQDAPTGATLFMGRVLDPGEE